jgi:plastocyanin
MKKVAALLALVVASVALVACGSSSSSSSSTTTATSGGESTSGAAAGGAKEESSGGSSGGASSTVKIEADPGGELAYTTTTATAKAGEVTIDFKNPQALTHDVAIEDSSGKEVGATELIASGEDSTTVNLKPGTYTYFCTVPGHREAGMEGTLTVK